MLKAAIGTRKAFQTWSHPHIERYITSNFYAFTRGKVLIAVTNNYAEHNIDIGFHEYKNGE